MIGRKRVSKQVRELIFRMVAENPTWGAPRIHGELVMLGFELSERTVSRWMRRALRNPQPAKRWFAFLRNHREAIAAMDFFTVPTVTFRLLYCFFVITVTNAQRRDHDSRLPWNCAYFNFKQSSDLLLLPNSDFVGGHWLRQSALLDPRSSQIGGAAIDEKCRRVRNREVIQRDIPVH